MLVVTGSVCRLMYRFLGLVFGVCVCVGWFVCLLVCVSYVFSFVLVLGHAVLVDVVMVYLCVLLLLSISPSDVF